MEIVSIIESEVYSLATYTAIEKQISLTEVDTFNKSYDHTSSEYEVISDVPLYTKDIAT